MNTIRRTILSRRFLVVFVIVWVLTYVLEHVAEALTSDQHNHAVSESIFSARSVYERLVTSWPRRLVPRYTVLIEIDAARDPTAISLHRICDQREFVARLVTAVASHEPAVIVIDKYFGADTCPLDSPGTAALRRAISTIGRRVPIIVGLRIPSQLSPEIHDVVQPPALKFSDSPQLREAIINLDIDTRRVPLGWHAAGPDSKPEFRYSLALQTAQSYDSMLFEKYPTLQDLTDKKSHPYSSMIRREDFKSYLAGVFLCGSQTQIATLVAWCSLGGAENLDYVRGRIVVIGEVHPDIDQHQAVIGPVPGMILQANYIEALLDERYFRPAPFWVNCLIGFFFFVAIELALLERPWWKALVWVAISIVVTFVVLSLIVRHLGIYVNPATFSLLVLILTIVFWARDSILKRMEERK